MNDMNVLNNKGIEMKLLERIASVFMRLVMCSMVWLLWLPGSARADVSCHSSALLAYTLNFPATVAVARDLPNGSALTTWVPMASVQNLYTCSVTNSWYAGVVFDPAGVVSTAVTSYTLSYNGTPFWVYPTNVPGVGIALGGYIYTNGLQNGPFSMGGAGGPLRSLRNFNGPSVPDGGQLIAALVKIGDITPGTVGGLISQAQSVHSLTSNGTRIPDPTAGVVNISMTPVAITVLTCETPDINVPMGTQMPSNFSGIGAASNKSSSFNVSLNNCPAGVAVAGTQAGLIHSIQYKIDPSDGQVSGFSNVAVLSGSTKAGGIGIQLYDNTGAVFPLSTFKTLNGFDGTAAASYTIPMVARYFQTGSITPGPANATMTVTMSYQ
jgi:major type 1 subunit fimbrin (pilin)